MCVFLLILAVFCGEPPAVGMAFLSGSGSYTFNSTLRYVCRLGHYFGRRTPYRDVRCNEFGLWENVPDTDCRGETEEACFQIDSYLFII